MLRASPSPDLSSTSTIRKKMEVGPRLTSKRSQRYQPIKHVVRTGFTVEILSGPSIRNSVRHRVGRCSEGVPVTIPASLACTFLQASEAGSWPHPLAKHLVRNPGMVPNETICGVRRFHRVVFQRCVRCPPILHESFQSMSITRLTKFKTIIITRHLIW